MAEITPDALRAVSVFEELPDDILTWFLSEARLIELAKGEFLFQEGDPADDLFVLLEGEIHLVLKIGGQAMPIGTYERGSILGVLPYSRMKNYTGDGQALIPSQVLALHRDHFQEMEQKSQELTQRLVAVMTTRVREGTKTQQQREKMMALGKLSAGLAHELNNPASAMRRTAAELEKKILHLPDYVAQLGRYSLSSDQMHNICTLIKHKLETEPASLSLLERSSREDELTDWLEERGVEAGCDLAEPLVQAGLAPDDLEALLDDFPSEAIPAVMAWLEGVLATTRLTRELQEASARISQLVGSIKSYTHMDRTNEKEPIDLREGLRSTLVMMKHKLKSKNIQLKAELDKNLPQVNAAVGELNQVWTNLIDNAVDAMEERGGVLQISAEPAGEFVRVEVTDNGTGIPEDIQSRIFEPFFTTKKMGEGTGLGLDIVQRVLKQHQASIQVTSAPGQTTFQLCFPVAAKSNSTSTPSQEKEKTA
ncbi:Cyclic nucleotide-binding domain-containing protein [Catalinimonas alkaloidigena]|uniref:histidine kinase n=1 Tax=Catalinimonas alkaloidigena TaxID=1075417 RepID=A0A1G9EEV0_9BACT|nr:ATP-binding protein [Catalinimonas alkaloidigena]SDK74591.1 Cyclic nucleotide-binding domain-containing protein [Catalinimonas alkaloidigena]